MHEVTQKFENTLNQCNLWLDRSEKDLLPDKYQLEPLELIVAEKNFEQISVKYLILNKLICSTYLLNYLFSLEFKNRHSEFQRLEIGRFGKKW
jgi:hypothetical protein